MRWFIVFLTTMSCAAHAQDIFILGEVHDNPAHHAVQAERTADIQPRALVFEMLSAEQAARITPDVREDEQTLREMLEWDNSGWPDFSLYYPIFAAAPDAQVFGAAIDRASAREVMGGGTALALGGEEVRYGLTQDLPPKQQAEREALQRSAHCDALPEDLLPAMVAVQRTRDAALARAAVTAHDATGGPVVVITGNGHARADWGVPYILSFAAPGLEVFTLGQGEDGGTPPGGFNVVVSAPAPERGDPCAAFR